MFEPTFGHFKNRKTVTYSLPGFSSQKTDVWVPQFKNRSIKTFEKTSFKYFIEDRNNQNFLCTKLFSFVLEKPHVDPEKHGFWDGMNLRRRVYMG